MGLETRDLSLLATSIGSLPHTDPVAACRVMTDVLPIPAWPQLPRRSFKENMYAQYSEGFPGVVVDEAPSASGWIAARTWTPGWSGCTRPTWRTTWTYGAISPDYAAGFHAFLRSRPGRQWPAVKGSVTGPISWGLTVTDQDKRAILYDDTLADAVAKHLRLKAAWQERELRKFCDTTIIFVDEPYMSAYGSAFFSLERDLVVQLLTETMAGIQGLIGVHCCGNTDWSLLMETPADILNFDAYAYAESVALYPDAVRAFLRRGGLLAWGIVPAEDEEAILQRDRGQPDGPAGGGHGPAGEEGHSAGPPAGRLPGVALPAACAGGPSRTAVRALQLAVGVTDELRRRFGR